MDKWIQERLSVCLDFEIPSDMIKYILAMKSSEEFDDYFQSLLNYDLPQHRLFVSDCKQKLFGQSQPKKQNAKSKSIKPLPKPESKPATGTGIAEGQPVGIGAKKKTKYVNLYADDGKTNVIMLQGRRMCECEAREHGLVNNCLSCGRIVCEQEGSGPCMFCGKLVCTEEEKKSIRGKKGETLKRSLMEKGGGGIGLQKALEHRDRLLEYNDACEKRTTVIDDEMDYFESNSAWMSEAQREKVRELEAKAHAEKHASRLDRKVTIDFAGREIVEEQRFSQKFEEKILQEINQTFATNSKGLMRNKGENIQYEGDVDPNIEIDPPVYIPSGPESQSIYKDDLSTSYNRVQDQELLEMQDMRHCMSMHQPWASLLIAGIKKHEGRTWYSSHRGRLWIASTAKPVDMDEVKQMEHFYRVYYNDESIKFPIQYPSGSLLGCVKVEDCLTQEQYRKEFPGGESESPFVFICSNPEELPIRLPVKGMHKIYKLEQKVHTAAAKSLYRAARLMADKQREGTKENPAPLQ